MSDFLPLVKKEYNFQGDTIATEFARLTRQQMMVISPLLPSPTGEKDDDGNRIMEDMSPEDNLKLLDKAIGFLADNMESFAGLKDAEGVALEFDGVVNQAYFTALLSDIAMDLISESMVKEKKQTS